MFNFPNELELLNILYTKDKTNKEILIATTQISSHNVARSLGYEPGDNPFDQNRISGSLNLVNGNGTLIFKLKNLQYDEDGVFTLESFIKVKDEFGISLKVQGELIR